MPTWLLAMMAFYALFLAGFSTFMHFAGKKAGDNQHRILLLPPPPGWMPTGTAGPGAIARRAAV